MAKLFNASEDIVEIVDNLAEEAELVQYMNIKVLGTNKQKQVVKVKKASPVEETLGQCEDSIIIIVCEPVFDMLSEEQQKLVVKDALSCVAFDFDKNKIIVTQPELACTIGGRQKMGDDLLNALETAVLCARQLEEKKKEERDAKKKKK